MPEPQLRQRIRDPHRREKIVEAAAGLIAADGYATVSIAQIGEEAGIVGSGVYRHFDSKAAVLVAIFDQVIDGLLADEEEVIGDHVDPEAALGSIIDGQVDFVVGSRTIAEVYYSEVKNLPEADRRRLRRKQRQYIEA
ncbi:MAG: TetR/AcrR family transcriptional regulator, partial [Acidimicrobiales bacterium]